MDDFVISLLGGKALQLNTLLFYKVFCGCSLSHQH